LLVPAEDGAELGSQPAKSDAEEIKHESRGDKVAAYLFGEHARARRLSDAIPEERSLGEDFSGWIVQASVLRWKNRFTNNFFSKDGNRATTIGSPDLGRTLERRPEVRKTEGRKILFESRVTH
jgi:hypothetical protein